MKAQLLGFVWTMGKGITVAEFFAHLATLKGKPERFSEHDRLLYVGTRGDYHVGLFLKLKDQRRSAEIARSGTAFRVTVRELEEGTNLIDFNFFILHKQTGRGVYQHYHQSCSLNQFGIFCSNHYDELKKSKIATAHAANGPSLPSEDQKKRADRAFKGSLTWENMVRKEALSKLLRELDRIKFFDFTLTTIEDNDALVRPLKAYAKKNRRIVRFGSNGSGLIPAIVGIAQRSGITGGRVGGVDAENRERVFRLIENPDTFGEYEYDELANDTVLNLANVEQSPFFERMLGIVTGSAEMKAIFETPVRV